MNSKRDDKGRFRKNVNRWEISHDIAKCYLGDELLFYTDVEKFSELQKHTFTKMANGYAGLRNGDQSMLVHRFITKAKKGELVDHIDRNKKNNRAANLRITDRRTNALNSGLWKTNTSGHKGVYFRKDTKKWVAEIKFNYQKTVLGCFNKIEDAIIARERAEAIINAIE